jgi:hypothetical protein
MCYYSFNPLIHSFLFMILMKSVMCRNINNWHTKKLLGKQNFISKKYFHKKKIVTNLVIKCYFPFGYVWVRMKFRFLYAVFFFTYGKQS